MHLVEEKRKSRDWKLLADWWISYCLLQKKKKSVNITKEKKWGRVPCLNYKLIFALAALTIKVLIVLTGLDKTRTSLCIDWWLVGLLRKRYTGSRFSTCYIIMIMPTNEASLLKTCWYFSINRPTWASNITTHTSLYICKWIVWIKRQSAFGQSGTWSFNDTSSSRLIWIQLEIINTAVISLHLSVLQVFKGGLFKTATEHKEQMRYFSQQVVPVCVYLVKLLQRVEFSRFHKENPLALLEM